MVAKDFKRSASANSKSEALTALAAPVSVPDGAVHLASSPRAQQGQMLPADARKGAAADAKAAANAAQLEANPQLAKLRSLPGRATRPLIPYSLTASVVPRLVKSAK